MLPSRIKPFRLQSSFSKVAASRAQQTQAQKCCTIQGVVPGTPCFMTSTSRCRMRRFQSSIAKTGSSGSKDSITIQDVQTLQKEIKSLQVLLEQSRMQQNEALESLLLTFNDRASRIELRLNHIDNHVGKISAMEQVVNSVRDLMQHNAAIRSAMINLETIVQRTRPFVQNYKYVLWTVAASAAVIWKYRASLVYERTSEEVADLARRTLEQESLRRSIQETLQTVANSPATLTTLNDLLQSLIAHERTQQDLVNLLVFAVNTPEVQKALLELLQVVFRDPQLQALSGEFLLKGLDMESVKAMLDAQTAQLVRKTVSDDSVQQATAVGLQRSLWYSLTPPFLWRLLEHKHEKTQTDREDHGIAIGGDSSTHNIDSSPPNQERTNGVLMEKMA